MFKVELIYDFFSDEKYFSGVTLRVKEYLLDCKGRYWLLSFRIISIFYIISCEGLVGLKVKVPVYLSNSLNLDA